MSKLLHGACDTETSAVAIFRDKKSSRDTLYIKRLLALVISLRGWGSRLTIAFAGKYIYISTIYAYVYIYNMVESKLIL